MTISASVFELFFCGRLSLLKPAYPGKFRWSSPSLYYRSMSVEEFKILLQEIRFLDGGLLGHYCPKASGSFSA